VKKLSIRCFISEKYLNRLALNGVVRMSGQKTEVRSSSLIRRYQGLSLRVSLNELFDPDHGAFCEDLPKDNIINKDASSSGI
jgi:hypothetical protein